MKSKRQLSIQRSFRQLEQESSDEFCARFLGQGQWHLWRLLREADLNRALRLAARKLPSEVFAWFPFSELGWAEMRAVLKALAGGKAPVKTHWPIVAAMLSGIVRHDRLRAGRYSVLVPDIVAAYNRLTPGLQRIIAQQVTQQLVWEPEDKGFCRRYSPADFDPPAFQLANYAKGLADETMRLVFGQTLGTVGCYCYAPQLDELNDVARALVANLPPWYYLTLDFKSGPLPGGLKRLPSQLKGDLIPLAEQTSEREQRLAARWAKPPEARPLLDYLGGYFWDSKVGPHIVLRVERIMDAAKQLGVQFEHLLAVVWLHEFAHLLHWGIPDADGHFNPCAKRQFTELLAQWATWKAVEDKAPLLAAFETLCQHQAAIYREWQRAKHCCLAEVEFVQAGPCLPTKVRVTGYPKGEWGSVPVRD